MAGVIAIRDAIITKSSLVTVDICDDKYANNTMDISISDAIDTMTALNTTDLLTPFVKKTTLYALARWFDSGEAWVCTLAWSAQSKVRGKMGHFFVRSSGYYLFSLECPTSPVYAVMSPKRVTKAHMVRVDRCVQDPRRSPPYTR